MASKPTLTVYCVYNNCPVGSVLIPRGRAKSTALFRKVLILNEATVPPLVRRVKREKKKHGATRAVFFLIRRPR